MSLHLNSIILFACDVERLKNFYTDNFGFEVKEETGSEWALLKAGECELGLHKIGPAFFKTVGSSPGAGNNVKMIFETTDDIYSLHRKLLEKGVSLQEIKTWDNFPYLLFDGKDPEGNVFQVRMRK